MPEDTDKILESLCDDPTSARERLLHVAGMMFADRGIDAVSTRELTKAAGANLSAIAYYFGGKEGLYNEAIDYTILRRHPKTDRRRRGHLACRSRRGGGRS